MRHLWFGILTCAAMLVACGDDGSDFSTRPSDGSSSSLAKSSSSAKSSDSVVGCKTEKEDNCEYDELADDRDGQTYKTVKIGDQWWMAENLNYEADSSFCYKDSAEYCEQYGRLYTWAAAMDSVGTWSTNGKGCGYGKTCSPTYPVRGVCPEGWHLPTSDEFETLLKAVGGEKKLMTTIGWANHEGKNGNGTDAFGFSALPAGFFDYNRYYKSEGESTSFWSSTGGEPGYANFMSLSNYNSGLTGVVCPSRPLLIGSDFGFSVRCVKD